MNFFQKNWVFFSGLIAAAIVAAQQLVGSEPVDLKVLGYTVLMAALSYVANQWRGKGPTIIGIIGTLSATFITVSSGGHVEWSQFGLQAAIAVLAAIAPPPKSEGYEQTATIENAKIQGKQITDSK